MQVLGSCYSNLEYVCILNYFPATGIQGESNVSTPTLPEYGFDQEV